VKEKAKTSMDKVRQLGKLTKSVKKNIVSAKSVIELDEIVNLNIYHFLALSIVIIFI
jgi:hypothetical protein